jgi:hypothetical protein
MLLLLIAWSGSLTGWTWLQPLSILRLGHTPFTSWHPNDHAQLTRPILTIILLERISHGYIWSHYFKIHF